MTVDIRNTKFRGMRRVCKINLIKRNFQYLEWEDDTAYPLEKINHFWFESFASESFIEVKYIHKIPFYRTCLNQNFPTEEFVANALQGKYFRRDKWPCPIIDYSVLNTISPVRYPNMSYVYILKTNYKEFGYKIGKSNNPIDRGSTIGLSMPFETEIIKNYKIKTQQHALLQERALHELFAHKNIKGEWFDLTDEDLEDIDRIIKGEYFMRHPLTDRFMVIPDRKECPFY